MEIRQGRPKPVDLRHYRQREPDRRRVEDPVESGDRRAGSRHRSAVVQHADARPRCQGAGPHRRGAADPAGRHAGQRVSRRRRECCCGTAQSDRCEYHRRFPAIAAERGQWSTGHRHYPARGGRGAHRGRAFGDAERDARQADTAADDRQGAVVADAVRAVRPVAARHRRCRRMGDQRPGRQWQPASRWAGPQTRRRHQQHARHRHVARRRGSNSGVADPRRDGRDPALDRRRARHRAEPRCGRAGSDRADGPVSAGIDLQDGHCLGRSTGRPGDT